MTVLAGYLQTFAGFIHSVQGGSACVVVAIVVIKSALVLNDAVGVATTVVTPELIVVS